MDPGVLYGNKATIEARVMDVIKKARSQGVRWVGMEDRRVRWCSLGGCQGEATEVSCKLGIWIISDSS